MFSAVFPVLAPVIVCALIGFTWAKSGKPFHTDTITNLALTIGVPTLVTDTLLNAEIETGTLGMMALASAIVHAGAIAAAFALLSVMKLPKAAFLPCLSFGNTGNMALPLCLFAFGEPGLAMAIAFFTVSSMAHLTLTPMISSGRPPLKALFSSPLIWSVTLAVALKVGEVDLPLWITNTIGLLGKMVIPIMLIALGVSLARLQIASLGRSLLFGIYKPLIGFGLGWAAILLLGLEGIAAGVVLIQAAMPPAVFNYLFAARFNQRPEEVAGIVVISTLLSFLTLPLLLSVAMGMP